MTRRITGSSQSTANKTPYVLPIGHLSTKSSVYSPVSMSRMSQDLVRNHMKSHYQRISSAKACVDTSAPKSLKLTIKEKDRKRKEALLVSNTQKSFSRSSSRQSNTQTSNSPRDQKNNPSFTDVSTKDTESSPFQQRPSSTRRPTSQTFRENGDMEQMHYNQRLKERAMLTNQRSNNNDSFRHRMQNGHYERFERHKRDPTINLFGMQNNENGKISATNNFQDSVRHHINDNNNNERYLRRSSGLKTKHSSGSAMNEKPNVTDTSHPISEEWSELGTGRLENDLSEYRSTDRLYASTPRFEMGDEFEANPNLSLSTVSFSYKSSPTRRKPKRRDPEEIIWTEEQKYLQFISNVTNDVLARGICSNRVINKVFESHIEKRKDDLDEENMREMINQLKEDLGVTND